MGASNSLQVETFSFEHDGITRTYHRHVSPLRSEADIGDKLPCILALHGGFGNGKGMRRLTAGAFETLEERTVVLYPDGVWRHWNDDRQFKGKNLSREPDDVAFLKQVVRREIAKGLVDPGRVYATGMSNGGFMSYRLAREASDLFAAVAPVCALMSYPHPLDCYDAKGDKQIEADLEERYSWTRPMPMVIILGSDDNLVPISGGPVGALKTARLGKEPSRRRWQKARDKMQADKRGITTSLEQTITFVAKQNGCCPEPVSNEVLVPVVADGTAVRRMVFDNCSGKEAPHPLECYIIEGAGHVWPGGSFRGQWLCGKQSSNLDTCAVIWDFFKHHRLYDH